MWQTALGRCIYQSKFGHQVWQNYRYRWLTFSSSAIQSIIHRKHPTQPVTACVRAMCLATKHNPGKTLYLGVGGACIAQALLAYRNEHEWTLVENDAQVLKIAKKYFYLDNLEPMQLICNDAQTFLAQDETFYKNIIVDMANAQSFPPELENIAFFKSLSARLQNQAIITLNLPDPKQHYTIYNIMKTMFSSCVILQIPKMSNIILVCGNFNKQDALLQALKLNLYGNNMHWHSHWGTIVEMK